MEASALSLPVIDEKKAAGGRGEAIQEEGVAHDFVTVDRTSCCMGDTVLVTWEIGSHPLHDRDYIAMYEVEERTDHTAGGKDHMRDHMIAGRDHMTHVAMGRLLDSRLRGDTSIRGGVVMWILAEDIFPKRKSCDMIM